MKIDYGKMTSKAEEDTREYLHRWVIENEFDMEFLTELYVSAIIAYRKDQMTIMHIVNDVNRNVHRYKRGEIPLDELYIQPSVIVEEEK